MDLKTLQSEINARWGAHDTNPRPRTQEHCFVHLVKALGKVANAVEEADHEQRAVRGDEVKSYLADLVICTARYAEQCGIDLDTICRERIEDKFKSAPVVSCSSSMKP